MVEISGSFRFHGTYTGPIKHCENLIAIRREVTIVTNTKEYRFIENSERNPIPGAIKIGPADAKESLSVSIQLRRRPDAPPLIDMKALAATPARQRKHMKREEYAATYGASQSDIDSIAGFARKHGFKVVESSTARRTVVLSGTV